MADDCGGSANSAKASFDDIYSRPDPRDYYSVLGALDYVIPDLARPIVQQTVAAWRRKSGRDPNVVDLGSSYGVNAALLRFPVSFEMLRRRYARREMLSLTSADLRALDRHYFQAWPQQHNGRIVALDVSQPAIDYACAVGVADAGFAENLEDADPSAAAARALRDADLVMSTGAVGYVGVKTFRRLIQAAKRPPWILSFVLRMFDYEPIAGELARSGLVTEKLASAAFIQRRFRDDREAGEVLRLLESLGRDPAGAEADGYLVAELYLSRPEEDVAALPLEDMVRVTSGRNVAFGPRLLRLRREGRTVMSTIR